MKGVKRITASSYEIGDFVAIVDDSHVFDGQDLQNGRAEEILPVLTEAEISKLIMGDEQINLGVGRLLPGFRSLSTATGNLKQLHRRKYHYNNGVMLKANAQER